ncbi:MAG: MobB mobilization protein [Burkholderiales bacterium]|nr:MobB mobilization protein [Burkholderiales bacterium]
MAVGKGRGRPPKSRTEKREKQVNIRLTDDELNALERDAELSGRHLSGVVRERVLGREISARADMAAVNELRRQGGLLKDVHVQSRGAYRDATRAAIESLRAAIERVGRE